MKLVFASLAVMYSVAAAATTEEGACWASVNALCPEEAAREDFLFHDAAGRLTCLAQNQGALEDACFLHATSELVDLVDKSKTPCKDEFRKKCGKALDELKREIEATSVLGTVKAALALAECVATNAEDLWAKCKPTSCSQALARACPAFTSPAWDRALLDHAPERLACLVAGEKQLGSTCFFQGMSAVLDDLDKKASCKDELRKKCGKAIDALKRAVQDTNVLGTVQAAVDVAECVVSNAEDLWAKCKPHEARQCPRVLRHLGLVLLGVVLTLTAQHVAARCRRRRREPPPALDEALLKREDIT